MKKMHIAGVGIGIAILVCLFSVWFWSLGAIASEDVPYMRLDAVQGKVEWKRETDANWGPLTETVDVRRGDMIRTSADGKAEIRWGDRGITRIDSDSQVTVEDIPEREIPATNVLIRLRVTSGRAWSRMLKLLDVQSAVEVESGGIVATVRGTAFGVAAQASSTDVMVSDSVVRVSSVKNQTELFVRQGRVSTFSLAGALVMLRDAENSDAWFSENVKADEQFDRELEQEIAQRFRQRIPRGPMVLIDWSERLHERVARGEEKTRLASAYAARHIAEVSICSTDISCRTNLHRLRFVQDVLKELPENDRKKLALDALRALFLHRPLRDASFHTELVAALQGLRGQLVSAQPQPFSDAITIDDHIDAAIVTGLTENVRQQLIQDVSDWFAPLQSGSGIPEDQLALLRQKAISLDERLSVPVAAFPVQLESSSTSTSPLLVNTQATMTIGGTGGLPKPVTAPGTSPSGNGTGPAPVSQPVCGYRSLSVFAKPDQGIRVGDRVVFSVYLVCADGRVLDVTTQAIFQIGSQTQGSISGNVLVPRAAGPITVTTLVIENGTQRTQQTVLQVAAAIRVPTSIVVTTSGQTTLTTGQRAPLTARVAYSDGASTEVTYQCSWSSSDAKIGSVNDSYFTALSGTGGTAFAICTYTEAGITVKGSLLFTVKMDPALQPTVTSPVPVFNPNRIF